MATFWFERRILCHGQGTLPAFETWKLFPEQQRWDVQALTKQLPAVHFDLQHETCGQGQVKVALPRGVTCGRKISEPATCK